MPYTPRPFFRFFPRRYYLSKFLNKFIVSHLDYIICPFQYSTFNHPDYIRLMTKSINLFIVKYFSIHDSHPILAKIFASGPFSQNVIFSWIEFWFVHREKVFTFPIRITTHRNTELQLLSNCTCMKENSLQWGIPDFGMGKRNDMKDLREGGFNLRTGMEK